MSFREFANRTIKVRNRTIGVGQPIFLTGEIGSAHNGSLENAKMLVKAAAEAGCDGADIFMANPESFFVHGERYPETARMMETLHRLDFTEAEWFELFEYAKAFDIILYPTPLDLPSIELCRRLGVEMININSDDANNYFMLKAAATLGVPVTFHDIAMGLPEVLMAVKTLQENGCRDIIILHSTHESGTLAEQYASANLEVINSYRQLFTGTGVLPGCVEHTSSDFLIYAVAAFKPALISKHIQIKASDNESDATISVDIANLSAMVQKVRYVEQAIGGGLNQIVVNRENEESEWSWVRRKVLVSARPIPAGKVIEEADLTAKRPGNLGGVSPMQYVNLIGAKAKQDIPDSTILEFSMFDDIQSAPYKFPSMYTYVSRDMNVKKKTGA